MSPITRAILRSLALAILFLPSIARADDLPAVQATSGSFIILGPQSNLATLSLSGPGFSLSGINSVAPGNFGVVSESPGTDIVSIASPFFFGTGTGTWTAGGTSMAVSLQDSVVKAPFTASFATGSPEIILNDLIPISAQFNVCSPTPGGFGDPLGGVCIIPNELIDEVLVTGTVQLTLDLVETPGTTNYTVKSATYTLIPTPEPATLALLLVGVVAFALWRRRSALASNRPVAL